ncbi:MAG: hypothetical protein M5E90_02965 [Asgard group archaeon]|nr:hypothetical protein [Asgard group archaeon]
MEQADKENKNGKKIINRTTTAKAKAKANEITYIKTGGRSRVLYLGLFIYYNRWKWLLMY